MLKDLLRSLSESRSIVGRLTSWYICSSFILVFLSTFYLYWSLSRALIENNDKYLETRLRVLNSIAQRKLDPIGALHRRIESEWPFAAPHQALYVRIFNSENKLVTASPGIPTEVLQEVYPQSRQFKIGAYIPAGRYVKTKKSHSYTTLSEILPDDPTYKKIKRIEIALDLGSDQEILVQYEEKLILVLSLTLLLSAFIGLNISKTGFKPVQNIIDLAARVRSTTLHERISDKELPVELKALAYTINEMLDRLEDSFYRLSRFSSDIAHELRTPVNNLRGELEVTLTKTRSTEEYQDVLQSGLEESIRISRIIDSLLFLAKAENPQTQIQKEIVLLDMEMKKILEFYEPTATEAGISIESFISESTSFPVERTLFQRAIGNILANAINYTPSGGKISVCSLENENNITIAIKDTGEGISEVALPLVFDRFFRADESRTATKLGGFGLGLTIVKSILKLHHGEIQIKSELHQGTEVFLSFPKI